MKKLFIIFILFFTVVNYSQQESPYVPGEILVQMKAGHNASELVLPFSAFGIEVKQLLSDDLNIWLISFDEKVSSSDEALSVVRQYPNVKAAQFNHYVTQRTAREDAYAGFDKKPEEISSTFPNDPRFNEQWALHNTGQSGGTPDADIDAPEAWDFATGGLTALGDTIVIAVIDGGADLNHPDIPYYKNWRDIPGNGIDDDGNGYIDDYHGWNAYNDNGNVGSNSHGTHVNGIAGAKGNNGVGVSGVNWNSKIMPIAGSSGTESVVIKAYGYVLKMRKLYNQTNGQYGAFVVVTNASFGVDYGQPANFPLWCAIYDSLGVQGVLSCGATANLNINIDIQGDIPTACPSDYLIAVTNTTNTDAKNSGAAYGLTTIDLGAPGTSILSTYPNNTYSSLTGTSMATPTVAGAVALMFSAANNNIIQMYKNNLSYGALFFKQMLLEGTDPIPALQNITVTGGRLNVYNAVLSVAASPDTVPPTQVTNLNVTNPTSNTLTVNWTAPLDTSTGGVVAYDLRRSLTPITDSISFYNATQIPVSAANDTLGTPRSVLVSSLQTSTLYYFSLRSADRWGNWSVLSNLAQGTTLAAPQIVVNPDSLTLYLLSNVNYTDSLVISNQSANPSTLNFSVSLANNTFPENRIAVNLIPVTKDVDAKINSRDNDKSEFYGSIEGQGGPDAFGYKWIDSDEPNGPQYVWEDISTTGTAVTNWIPTGTFSGTDEGYAGPFNLGFTFKFYGVPYTQVYFSSNGFITFAPVTANTFTNASIPNSAVPNNFIAPFWDDLDGKTTGQVFYKQVGNKFIIQYKNWLRYSGEGTYNFQVVLHQGGRAIIYYNSMTGTLNSATIGIENQAGSIGLQTAYNSNYVKNNHALKYAAEPDWLSSNLQQGMLYNNQSMKMILSFNTFDLTPGLYSMDVVITSNDPLRDSVIIPIKMYVDQEVPVELTSFNAEYINGKVVLNWKTATETNNRGFAIERKRMNENLWTEAAFVNGKGTTTTTNSYQFEETSLPFGNYSYRLRQIDFDGTTSYSNEVEVNVAAPNVFSLEQNYPNPFNPTTKIKFSIPYVETRPTSNFRQAQGITSSIIGVSLRIYDIVGKEIATLINQEMLPGVYEIEFDGSQIPSGVYFYQLSTGKFISTKKFVLLK